MWVLVLAISLLLLSAIPLLMFIKNLQLFLPPAAPTELSSSTSGDDEASRARGVSILIPARNEESSIGDCIAAALASQHQPIEVIVLDDASVDGTGPICRDWIERDSRVKLLHSTVLPEGWNGKQHACWRLHQAATFEWMLFIDADVRLAPDAIGRLVSEAESKQIDLLSGFPKQITGTLLERLLIPLMHFILLGYLPIERMRASPGPEFAAGCGQLFLARRSAYRTCQGHRAISGSRHDGIKLPRTFRKAGLRTDIIDATPFASCRMYHSAIGVVRGLLKNATEGIGNPKTIVPFTILLAGASVLPLVFFVVALQRQWSVVSIAILGLATVFSFVPRALAAVRFQQSWVGTALHPLAVAVFLLIQWVALLMHFTGMKIAWRGRV